MTFEHLLTLIQSGESEQLEFKLSTGSLKASLETVCVLLNQKGGYVIFGITDRGQLVGQQVYRLIDELFILHTQNLSIARKKIKGYLANLK